MFVWVCVYVWLCGGSLSSFITSWQFVFSAHKKNTFNILTDINSVFAGISLVWPFAPYPITLAIDRKICVKAPCLGNPLNHLSLHLSRPVQGLNVSLNRAAVIFFFFIPLSAVCLFLFTFDFYLYFSRLTLSLLKICKTKWKFEFLFSQKQMVIGVHATCVQWPGFFRCDIINRTEVACNGGIQ